MSVILKNIDETDYNNILDLTTNINVMKYIGNGKIWDTNKVKKFIKYNLEEENISDSKRKNYYYKIQEKSKSIKIINGSKTDNFVGIIGFHIMNNKNKNDNNIKYNQFYLTIYLNPNKQGKGYFSSSINSLIKKINKHQPNCKILYSLVRKTNEKMNNISRNKFNFIREVELSGVPLNEYGIVINKYTCIIESEYVTNTDINNLLKLRDNWKRLDYNSTEKDVDFIYVDSYYFQNKKIQSIDSNTKNIIDDKKKNISEKDKLYTNLKTINDAKPFLLSQYNLDLIKFQNNENKLNQYKNLFNKTWIYKPVGGWSGKGIKIFNDFDEFKSYNKKIIKLNKTKWNKHFNKLKTYKNSIKAIKLSKNKNIEKINRHKKKIKTLKHKHKYSLQNEWILQEYIDNPLLFNNKKFHIRCYYLYTFFNNIPEAYIYQGGNIYTAKNDFKNEFYNDKNIHDTHLGSTDDDYYFPHNLDCSQEKKNKIQKQINLLGSNLFKIMKGKCYSENINCYELFGVDIMITDSFEVKLIEVNNKIGLAYVKDKHFFIKLLDDVLELTMDKEFINQKKSKSNNKSKHKSNKFLKL